MAAADMPRAAYVATFVLGIYGVLMAGLAPLLLGTLVDEGHLSAVQLGLAGTAELVTMGLAAGGTSLLVERYSPRFLALASVAAIIALDLATCRAHGSDIILLRALAGVPSGSLIGLVTATIVRTAQPARQAGLYLTLQTLAQLLCAAAISGLVTPHFGGAGAFAALAALGVPVALVALSSPVRLTAHRDAQRLALPDAQGWLGLIAAFCFFAGILAIWIYVEPLAHEAGLSPTIGGMAVALALAGQVAGGVIGMTTVPTWPCRVALPGSALALIGAAALLAALPGPTLFLATAVGFGVAWAFASPYFTRLLIEIDPSQRAALLGSAALLLGCAAGPTTAALAVGDGDVRGCLALGTVFLTLSGGIVLVLPLFRRVAPATALQAKGRS
jgi:predicted MFS family arabinose efflux permease